MNKILKMVGTASLIGSMLVFAGCGGGGGSDDNDGTPITPPTEVTTEVTTSGNSTATAVKDIYKFADGDISFTITGFADGDVLSFPAGSVTGVENEFFDGKVVLTARTPANKQVRVTLVGLTDADDRSLTSPAAFASVFNNQGTIATH